MTAFIIKLICITDYRDIRFHIVFVIIIEKNCKGGNIDFTGTVSIFNIVADYVTYSILISYERVNAEFLRDGKREKKCSFIKR